MTSLVMPDKLTQKERVWLACKEKSCCYSSIVIPSGRDVWSIARTLDVPPWAFLRYFQSPQPRGDAFALDDSGRLFRLALGKGPTRRTKSPPPCIFLMRTRRGEHRCGLGELRPAACHAFPSEYSEGMVFIRPETGCECRQWSLTDVDIEEELKELERRQNEAAEYQAVVQVWNKQLTAPSDFMQYCQYLLDVYDRKAARDE